MQVMSEKDKEHLTELTKECVQIAREGWQGCLGTGTHNSGDNNRTAIGWLSAVLLQNQLEKENEPGI